MSKLSFVNTRTPYEVSGKYQRPVKLAILMNHREQGSHITRLIRLQKDMEIVLETEIEMQLIESLRIINPDILILDLDPCILERNRLESIEKFKKILPGLKIIVLSPYECESYIVELKIRGVKSIIGKEEDPEEFIKAIRIIYTGGVYMTDGAAAIIQKELIAKDQRSCPVVVDDFEVALLKSICTGLSSTDIGKVIFKSPRTVEKYRENLYKKFDVTSKEELISLVIKWGLV